MCSETTHVGIDLVTRLVSMDPPRPAAPAKEMGKMQFGETVNDVFFPWVYERWLVPDKAEDSVTTSAAVRKKSAQFVIIMWQLL